MLVALFVANVLAAPVGESGLVLVISEDVMTSTVSFTAGAFNETSSEFGKNPISVDKVTSCLTKWLEHPLITIDVQDSDTPVTSVMFEGFTDASMFKVTLSLQSAYALSELHRAIMKPWPYCENVKIKSTSLTSTTTSTGVGNEATLFGI